MKTPRGRTLASFSILSIATLTIFVAYSASRLTPAAGAASTFIVFNTNDGGAGSLRQAIITANANAGVDTIKFNLPPGASTISPGSGLPAITDPVIIDGYSQIGTSPNNQADSDSAALAVEIDGTNVPPSDSCLTISAGGSTVQGLVINRCRFGIRIDTVGGNTIQGNFFGTDPTGTIRRANSISVNIIGSPNNTIGGTTPAARNLISGNSSGQGVAIQNPASTGNVVAGNFIGTNAAGTAALNNSSGVIIISDASGNTIGGTAAGARNLISGNSTGISISGASTTGNVVAGNYIGTNPAGTAVVGNSTGITLAAPGNTVGGTTVAARNIISGNANIGVSLTTGAATNLVQGNYIGLNSAGDGALLNGRGVVIQNGATDNLVGGTAAGARNIISGNSAGVVLATLSGTNNRIENNFIGTNTVGTAGIPNGVGVDIQIGSGNVVGGTAAGAGNVIAFNSNGVVVEPPFGGAAVSGDPILGNSIFSNNRGIDLNNDGVTPNDVGDGDTGSNNLQNYPILTAVTSGGGSTTIAGNLNSTPSMSFRIEFFANTALDNSRFGQGQTFIGSTTVTTDGGGNTSFSVSTGSATPSGQFITATATNNTTNDTSEFSQGVTVNGPETLQFSAPVYNVSENGGNATITVTRVNGGGGSSSVQYGVFSAVAIDGADFTGTSNSPLLTLTFNVGETSKDITVPIIDDVLVEGDEFFIVALSNPSMGTVIGGSNSVQVIINDREQTIFGVTTSNSLISFERANPATVYSNVLITGLQPGEQILGIDFRPSNGLLYGLGNSSRLYTIDTTTGVATQVGSGPFPPLSGPDFGFDFDPVADQIRIAGGASHQNFRLDPNTGVVVLSDTTPAYSGSDPNAAATPNVNGLAYSNNAAGATSTTLYGIDSVLDTLVRVGSPGGTPTSPNSGQLSTIGALGFNTGPNTSFDIAPGSDTGLAVLTQQSAPFSFLYTINLTTGGATLVNNFNNAPFIGGQTLFQAVRAMAVKTSGNIGFASASSSVSEGAGKVTITVNRTGDLSGAASADFTAGDGTAVQTSDHHLGYGTVFFAPGEASKTFDLLITDDGYMESPETFTISLSNPRGGFQVAGITSTTVTITDNDTVPAVTNPIDGASFFVRQHYVDFLNREPDTSGLNFWTGTITSCGADTQCTEVKRINGSAAFFLSIEFQKTGALVYLAHKAANGNNNPGPAPVPVLYQQFEHDTEILQQGLIFGQPDFDLKLGINRESFFKDFVARPQFEVAFPITLTPAQFADALIANTGVTFTATQRNTLINFFFGASNSSDQTARANALFQVAQNQAFAAAEFNRTFVAMEYFGYLRRDPDASGFNFWLNKLNSFNGDFIKAEMVKAFISSSEYRQRYGAN
jgi:hypothetical protein